MFPAGYIASQERDSGMQNAAFCNEAGAVAGKEGMSYRFSLFRRTGLWFTE